MQEAANHAHERYRTRRAQWVQLPQPACVGSHPDAHGPALHEHITPAQLDALYGPEGALYGKKRLPHVFARIKSATQYQLVPTGALIHRPRRNAREKLFWLALVHTLGFPDENGSYQDLRLRFSLPGGPVPADYYTVLVENTTADGKPLGLVNMYERTVRAARHVLRLRRARYDRGDFEPLLLRMNHEGFADATALDLAPSCAEERAHLRGTVLLHDMILVGKRVQPRSGVEPCDIPTQLQLTGQALHISSGSKSEYERYWLRVLEGYDPEQRFTDRVERIDRDLVKAKHS
jgi:hypothetical protein